MIRNIEHGMDYLMGHYLTICLFIALFILTWLGVGDIPKVCLLGLILCLAGLAQRQARVEIWCPLMSLMKM